VRGERRSLDLASDPRTASLPVTESVVVRWVQAACGARAKVEEPPVSESERGELKRLRAEVNVLRREREILKSRGLVREGEPVTANRFIDAEKANEPVRLLCRVLFVSRAAFYAWKARRSWYGRCAWDAALAVHIRAVWTLGCASPATWARWPRSRPTRAPKRFVWRAD
jgi:hypothetical protein